MTAKPSVRINEYGEVIPKHVSRVDSEKWHGWQVRWNGKTRKWFSDKINGGRSKALAAASAWAAHNYPGWQFRIDESEDAGIGTATRKNQLYIVAYSPKLGLSKKVYVGMVGRTVTDERVQQATAKAREIRRRFIEEYKAEVCSS